MSRTDNTMPFDLQNQDAKPGSRLINTSLNIPVSFGDKSASDGPTRFGVNYLRRVIRRNERRQLDRITRPNDAIDFDFMPKCSESRETLAWKWGR